MQKLGQITLYENNENEYTENEMEKIKAYEKILGYAKTYEKDLQKIRNGKIDLQGQRIDTTGMLYEKLINIEGFVYNALNNVFDLQIPKFQNKKVLNKGNSLEMTGNFTKESIYGPLQYVNNLYLKNQKQYIKKAKSEIILLEKKLCNRNLNNPKRKPIEKIKNKIAEMYL